jgi:hypothetical protein
MIYNHFTALGQWDRERIPERQEDINNTPENNLYPGIPPVAQKRSRCGWCESTHIADVTCNCKEPCDAGYCPAHLTEEEKMYL